MSRKDMQSDEIEEIMKEMLNDDEYADEGFEDIDREDNRDVYKRQAYNRHLARFARAPKNCISLPVSVADTQQQIE